MTRTTTKLYCPDCRHEVWDGPEGSKLAKCHGCGTAFDTMDMETGDARITPPSFVVIENTPGYMPDDDDPALFDDLDAAKEYLKNEVERFCDFLAEGYDFDESYEPNVYWSRELDHAQVDDPRREHDLGRVFSIEPVEA